MSLGFQVSAIAKRFFLGWCAFASLCLQISYTRDGIRILDGRGASFNFPKCSSRGVLDLHEDSAKMRRAWRWCSDGFISSCASANLCPAPHPPAISGRDSMRPAQATDEVGA